MNYDPGMSPPDSTLHTLLDVVSEVCAELHPGAATARRVTLDSALDRDLGIDSLGRVELLARIERRFDVSLPETVFAAAETPRDLLRALRGAASRPAGELREAVRPQPTHETTARPAQQAQTLVEALDWHVEAHPERVHLSFYADDGAGETLSYRQLRAGAEAVAAGLQRHEMQVGQAVAIMLPTGRDYFFAFFGILLAGGIPVPLYPPTRPSQLEDHLRRQAGILANCRTPILITVAEARRLARLLKAQVESLRLIATVTDLESEGGTCERPALNTNDIAFLQYTSGSTGSPKGVILSHANLLANIRADGEAIQATSSDVFVSWLPLYHDMGLIGAWLGSLYFGVQLVIMSPLAFLSRPQRWLRAMHHHRGTLSAAPNFGYELCLNKIDPRDIEGLDLSSWRIAFNGAEAVGPDTVEGFCRRFAPYGFRRETMFPVYGLAESAVGLAFPPLGRGPLIDRVRREPLMESGKAIPAEASDPGALRFVACGQPLPGHQIRVVDAAGRELPEREEGHLQFRGPSTTSGYYRNPQATRELFDGEWLDSGDLAYIAGGDVHITGRSKDVILRAGRNIYPHELEAAVGAIPGIRKGRVAAFGSSDPRLGTESLVIVAETREAASETRERLRREINGIATDLIGAPAEAVVLAPPGSVLKTSSGKIRRRAVRELYERGAIGPRAAAVWWQITRLALAGLVPQYRRVRRSAAAVLYASYAWLLYGLLAPTAWLGIALLPRFEWRWGVMRWGARLLARASFTGLSVRGREHLSDGDRSAILVSNHASLIDGMTLVAALPTPFSAVAKAELGESALLRIAARRIRVELVERFDAQQGMADAKRILAATGSSLPMLFFAEGTMSRRPGLLAFHMGAFVAAVTADRPVIPIAIRGTRSILRSGSWLPRHGTITVTIGAPIHPSEMNGSGDWERALALRDASRAFLLRHCGEPDLAREGLGYDHE